MRVVIKPRTPYRLDLTARALRRVTINVVDIVTSDGVYLRALRSDNTHTVVEVRQTSRNELDVRITGPKPKAANEVAEMMLGAQVNLSKWYVRARRFPWLATLSRDLRGMKPPRYPTLFEALCNGIIFQQLSIAAASAIMGRLVVRLSQPVEHQGVTLYPFPSPDALLDSRKQTLQAAGLSSQKASALRAAASAVRSGAITAKQIGELSSLDASAVLQNLPGIGSWSAANILLRGFGRLDVFPMGDSGASASIKLLSGAERVDIQEVLDVLGDMRGMLYFHLLLGRMRAAIPSTTL